MGRTRTVHPIILMFFLVRSVVSGNGQSNGTTGEDLTRNAKNPFSSFGDFVKHSTPFETSKHKEVHREEMKNSTDEHLDSKGEEFGNIWGGFGSNSSTFREVETRGCRCHNLGKEVTCKCFGEMYEDVPQNLSTGVTRLYLVSLGIQVLQKGSFKAYEATLTDLYMESLRKLHAIEPGVFDKMKSLRTIYIKQATTLKKIPAGVFEGNFPKMRIIRIIQSGLEAMPPMNLSGNEIMSMLDLDSNRIKNLTSGSIKVKAGSVNLNFNDIAFVQNWAFDGSVIADLSLKGNKRLTDIGEEAFVGLKSLKKLDLSETKISRLPTKGLEHVEILKIVKTYSLKAFPSVYNFKRITEAHLTYPYHCCAFKYPRTHDPNKYQSYQAFKEKQLCQKTATTWIPPVQHQLGTLRFRRELEEKNESIIEWLLRYPKRGLLDNRSIELLRSKNMREDELSDFIQEAIARHVATAPTAFSSTTATTTIASSTATASGSTLVDNKSDMYGKLVYTPANDQVGNDSSIDKLEVFLNKPMDSIGFGMVPDLPSGKTERKGNILPGIWEMTTAPTKGPPLEAICGEFAKDYQDVKCFPTPDAFNPCEDVMGNIWLRIAVWFVVVAAVLGNLAVMIVLMSGRFTMSVSKFLMCNLAFADFCMGFYLLIIAVVDVHTIGVYFNYAIDWQHGIGCKVAGFITVFASELSIFTLTVITLERWYAITYAIHLNRRLKLSLAVKIMISGWFYAIVMASLPLLGVSGYTKTSICLPMENNDAIDVAYLVAVLSINGLAFVLIAACYSKMYLSIVGQQTRATISDTAVAKRMALLVFTDFACWAPIAFFGLTAVSGYPLINVTNSKILLVFFYPLNSCANPFLYAILTKQYRRDFFILLSRYGFCTSRAAKYKGTSSNQHGNQRVLSKSLRAAPGTILSQASYENRRGVYRYRRKSQHPCHTSWDENSAKSVVYSTVDLYPESSISGDSSNDIVRFEFVSEESHSGESRPRKKEKGKKRFSANSKEKSSSPFRSPLNRLPSAEREEILLRMGADSVKHMTTSKTVWTTSSSSNSIHKSHKNCTFWIQRDSSSGEKSTNFEGELISCGKEPVRCPNAIENLSFVASSQSNSAEDTEM